MDMSVLEWIYIFSQVPNSTTYSTHFPYGWTFGVFSHVSCIFTVIADNVGLLFLLLTVSVFASRLIPAIE